MKFKKITAALLSASLLFSVAGCAGKKEVTDDAFINAAKRSGAEEYDEDDLDDYDSDDLEDGIYVVLDSDWIEDNWPDAGDMSYYSSFMGSSSSSLTNVLSDYDADDFEQIVFYAKAQQDGLDDMEEIEDLEDAVLDGVIGFHVTLADEDVAEDIMDSIEDILDELDIDTSDLSKNEYSTDKNGCALSLHINVEDFVSIFKDSDTYDFLEDISDETDSLENFDEVLDVLSGDVSVTILVSGINVAVVIGVSINEDGGNIKDFCSSLKISNPAKLPSNTAVCEAICDYIDDRVAPLISLYANLASYNY